MRKEEFDLIWDFVSRSEKFSDNAKSELKDILDNTADHIHLINSNDTRFVDYPQYWLREDIDSWLDKPLTDDEFDELSCRLSHLGSYDSEMIQYEINEIRS